MLTTMIIVFLVGYLLIALEHPLKINKAGTALLTGTILWVLYTLGAPQFIPAASAEEFKLFFRRIPVHEGSALRRPVHPLRHRPSDIEQYRRNRRNIGFPDRSDDYR